MLDVIHSPHSSPPAVYDLPSLLPSHKDLQTSVDKLRELCIPRKSTSCVDLHISFSCHHAVSHATGKTSISTAAQGGLIKGTRYQYLVIFRFFKMASAAILDF